LKTKLRKISVDNQIFVWSYSHRYDYGDAYDSRVFFSLQGLKHIGVECFFKTYGHVYAGCYLTSGITVIKDDKKYYLNFNTPRFIADFIRFVLANKVDFTKQKQYRFNNANDFLTEMGFHSFPYELFAHTNDERMIKTKLLEDEWQLGRFGLCSRFTLK